MILFSRILPFFLYNYTICRSSLVGFGTCLDNNVTLFDKTSFFLGRIGFLCWTDIMLPLVNYYSSIGHLFSRHWFFSVFPLNRNTISVRHIFHCYGQITSFHTTKQVVLCTKQTFLRTFQLFLLTKKVFRLVYKVIFVNLWRNYK